MPPSFGELAPRTGNRLLAVLVVRTSLSVTLLLVIYALVPVEPLLNTATVLRLVVSIALVALVIVLQVRAIRSASYPVLRAIEATIIAIIFFVIVFALLYLGFAASDPAHFSEPLNRVTAFYFTVTILSTVGFGDISARSDVARLLVTVQMLLDLAIIAIIVRVFSSVARTSRAE